MGADLFLNPKYILPMGAPDLKADEPGTGAQSGAATAGYPSRGGSPGQIFYLQDDLGGFRICRFLHNKQGAATVAGQPYVRAATVAIAAIDAASTTTLVKKAAGFTADALARRLLYYKTNVTAPGTAPEGETAPIVANTAGQVQLDVNGALSAAPNTLDAIDVYSLYDFIVAAGGENAVDVFGISLNPIADGNWGVIQSFGFCPNVKPKAAIPIVAGAPLVTDVAQVATGATSASKLWIGYAVRAVNNPNSGKMLAFLNCHAPFGPGTAS